MTNANQKQAPSQVDAQHYDAIIIGAGTVEFY
jgi:hypothetical protein